jgi:hypothetical protein
MKSEPISRRSFLRYMALLGMAHFATSAQAAKKLDQGAVQYQESPKNGEMCRDCMHFLPDTSECKLVEGTINPDGWCRLFVLPPDRR